MCAAMVDINDINLDSNTGRNASTMTFRKPVTPQWVSCWEVEIFGLNSDAGKALNGQKASGDW
jgi:hypothetical protein